MKKQYYSWMPFSIVDSPTETCAVLFKYGCNMVCEWCYNSDIVSYNFDNTEPLDYKTILNKINSILSFNFNTKKHFTKVQWLIISGGECLNSGFFELLKIIKLAKKIGLKIGIYTNGTHPYKLLYLIKRKLIQFVNVDYKQLTKNYSVFEREISRTLDICFNNLDKDLIIRLNTTLTRYNFDKLHYMYSDLRRRAHDSKIKIFWNTTNVKYEDDVIYWQLTPVRTDVKTMCNLGRDFELTESDKLSASKMLMDVYGKSVV